MNMITQFSQKENRMTNFDLFELVNEIRAQHGENKIRLSDFNNRIADELDGEYYENFVVQNSNNTISTGYQLTLEQCTLVGMRESKGVRKSVLQKLKQLENHKPRELSRLEIIEMALQAEQQKIALQHQVQILEPKAKALDDLADSTNTYTIREVAKTIRVQEKRLVDFLIKKHWIYRENTKYRRLCAYSIAVDKGTMINKVTKLISTSEGEKAYVQARITAFGLTRLTAMVKKAGLAA